MINLNPDLISKDGKPMFAVIPYEQFLAIKEMLEDFQDLQDLRAAKQEEYNQPAIVLNDVKQLLGLWGDLNWSNQVKHIKISQYNKDRKKVVFMAW